MPPFNPVASMLRTLLGMPRMDPQIQERIYTYAVGAKDTRLMAELAGRDDLDLSLDQLIGNIEAANVRAAWLAHPRRTLEQIQAALESETRSSVIKSLAARADLPDGAYALLVDKLGVNGLPALLSNDAIDHGTRVRVVERYVTLSHADGKSLPESVSDALASHPDLAHTVLENANSLLLIDEALNTAIPTPAQAQRIAGIVIKRAEAATEETWRIGNLREAICVRIEPYLYDLELRQGLADVLASGSIAFRSANTTAARLRKPPHKHTLSVENMRTTTSERVMTQTLSKAYRNDTPTLPLLAALAGNPACSPALFAELTVNHTRSWHDRALWRSVTNPEKAAALYCAWPLTNLDTMLARTSDHARTLALIIEQTLEQGHSISGTILASAYLTAETAHLLPIETFGYGADQIPVEALEAVEGMLLKHLASQEAWDTLAVIGRDYRGPLGQLLETASKLS